MKINLNLSFFFYALLIGFVIIPAKYSFSDSHSIQIATIFDTLVDSIEKDTKKANKIKQILEGTGNILSSTMDMDYQTEFSIGESLALEGLNRYGLSIQDSELQRYVNLMGNALAKNSIRFEIPYYVMIVNSSIYNAFACPGGIIFITSSLVELMNDESELAGVIAHEIAHVALKHAVQTLKRSNFFQGVGKITAATMKKNKGQQMYQIINGLQTVLFDTGLDKQMEFEADRMGMDIAYRTGYDPRGLIRVLQALSMQRAFTHQKGSWFSTHPPLSERINACNQNSSQYLDAKELARVANRFISYKTRIVTQNQ
ncbi:MAG: M48 family metalloprotease [Desulfobacterales bacterium]|nr:M48 family metalloprotease [Desulfobacterales bacterium]